MDVNTLGSVFAQTFSADAGPRKQSEAYLKGISRQPGFAVALLQLVADGSKDAMVRQAASVQWKNHLKFHWVAREDDAGLGADAPFVIPDAEKEAVKTAGIVGIMLSAPPLVQAQVSEAVAIISATDFPAKWPTLLPELMQHIASSDYAVVIGVLKTANEIFKRYRNAFRTDTLFTELKYVLEGMVTPLKELLTRTTQALQTPVAQDAATAAQLLQCVRLVCRVFYSLNSQDLPEQFEDSIAEWMGQFHLLLSYENAGVTAAAAAKDADTEGPLDAVKAAVCENINLYIEKFEEEFEPYLKTFVTVVWSLLMSMGQGTNTDHLAASAIRFLTTVAKSVHHKLFKENEGTLKSIVECVVIPNLQIREEDEELFDMNHVEYIRRDIEGSDNDTRRRMACELVKALTDKYPEEITNAVSTHVASLLAQYAANPAGGWKAKDCAIYLVVALTVRGATSAKGATSVNTLVNIGDFFTSHIAPELAAAPAAGSPFLKADALKFVTTFRSQIPKETLLGMLPAIVALMAHENCVVHSYAAHCMERLLMIKDAGALRFGAVDISPALTQLLTNLFGAFTLGDSAENEYLMKCVMRVIAFMGPEIKPFATQCQAQIVGMLVAVSKNPRNPVFNHYVFEAVAGLVKNSCSNDPTQCAHFEGLLFPPFQHILELDVQEFAPYVFQILSQLLETRPLPLPPAYMALFPPLLSPMLWERSGNVPALVRLLQAYLQKAHADIVSGNHLQAILGVFQKLVASKAHDHEGFYVLNTLLEWCDIAAWGQYLGTIWGILFMRLQSSRTVKFARSLTLFVGLFAAKHSPATLEESINKVQPGIFMQLLQGVFLGALATINGDLEKKICGVGFGKILCESASVAAVPAVWGKLLEGVVVMFEKAEHATQGDGEDELDEAPGFTAAFAQLHHSAKVDSDPVKEVTDPKQYITTALGQLSSRQPLAGLVSGLAPEVQQALAGYCTKYGVALA